MNEIGCTLEELKQEAERFLREEYDIPLLFNIRISGRLKRSLGQFKYLLNDAEKHIAKYGHNHVEIVIEKEGTVLAYKKDVFDTLRHELIHYALWRKGLPFDDKDATFINECNRLGVGLSGHIFSTHVVYAFSCTKCGAKLLEDKKKYITHCNDYSFLPHGDCFKTPYKYIGYAVVRSDTKHLADKWEFYFDENDNPTSNIILTDKLPY